MPTGQLLINQSYNDRFAKTSLQADSRLGNREKSSWHLFTRLLPAGSLHSRTLACDSKVSLFAGYAKTKEVIAPRLNQKGKDYLDIIDEYNASIPTPLVLVAIIVWNLPVFISIARKPHLSHLPRVLLSVNTAN